MKHMALMMVMASMLASLAAVDYVTIYDIQYTTSPGCEGAYPSPLVGEKVRTSGVVTAVDEAGGYVYISAPQGGAWNSLCLKAGNLIHSNRLRPGVLVEVTGEVMEQFGMTILADITDLETRGAQSSIPETPVTTGAIRNSEAYESVFVRLTNVSVVDHSGNAWRIDDGSGVCVMADGFNVLNAQRLNLDTEGLWREARGVVSFRFGEYCLNPRTVLDLGGQGGLNVNHTSWGRVKSLYR